MLSVIGYWLLGMALSAPPTGVTPNLVRDRVIDVCSFDPPEYYAINLVSTKRLPGTRMARGKADVTFAPSPYGIHISPNGTYVYDVSIKIDQLRSPDDGLYVAWLTTPDLEEVIRLGPLGESGSIEGRVDWNKFLVVVTLEEADDPDQERWAGPVALRGLSRSGLMHTMAGHGPFDQEPCAFYGYE